VQTGHAQKSSGLGVADRTFAEVLDLDDLALVVFSCTKRLMGRVWEGLAEAGVLATEAIREAGAGFWTGLTLSAIPLALLPEGFSADGGMYKSPYFSFSSS
jgi:hypothetical protein